MARILSHSLTPSPRADMINLYTHSLLVGLLVYSCSSASTPSYDSHFHQHTGADLDSVQCHHTSHRIRPEGGILEPVNGQESRVEPSRQYLPQPDYQKPVKIQGESPAASYDQPNFLTVDKSFISPTLQKNYKSLFGEKSKPDNLSPSAAQNVPTSIFPPAPRISSDKKHSHEDDEDNLERLCNDAFHSFLCKPITGPRKTPTGRLRPNAVIPPDVLAGLSSIPDSRRVLPDSPKVYSASNSVGQMYLPPVQPLSSNRVEQSSPFPKPTTTTTQRPPQQYLPPASFENILKSDTPDSSEIPSPSNTNSKVIKPQHDCDKSKPFSELDFASPSNDNSLFVQPIIPSTPKPFYNYFSTTPSKQLSSNNVPSFYPPLRMISPPHDCEKSKTTMSPFVANPSSNNPYYVKPNIFQNQKPVSNFYSPAQKAEATSLYSSSIPLQHDCNNSKAPSTYVPNPTNIMPEIVKPYSSSTQAPLPTKFTTKPTFPYFNNGFPQASSTQQVKNARPKTEHDCEKHNTQGFGTKSVANTLAPRYYSSSTINYFNRVTTESPKIPLPSNNIPQIIAQPQQINSVTLSPTPRGYFYDKPAIPFPPPSGSPSIQNPSVAQLPSQSPSTTTRGYSYDQPRIPFPSSNVARIVPQPQAPVFKSYTTTTIKPQVPCEHHGADASSPVIGNPTNDNIVFANPGGYVYDKPEVPFIDERGRSSNQNPISVRPTVTTGGYNYDNPNNPLSLDATNDNPSVLASPANNNGYTYEKPERHLQLPTNLPSNRNQVFANPQPPVSTQNPYSTTSRGYSYSQPSVPFPTSINSKLALPSEIKPNLVSKPQNQVEVNVRPGYSYDRPSERFETPEATIARQNVGYKYPKPGKEFSK